MTEKPYYTMTELADLISMSVKGLHNSMSKDSFPIPTYKLGKFRVADKEVVNLYFEEKRLESMRKFTTKI